MRVFVILSFVAFAAGDVSELGGNGYNYPTPGHSGHGGSDGGFMSGGDGSFGGDFVAGSSVEPSLSSGGFVGNDGSSGGYRGHGHGGRYGGVSGGFSDNDGYGLGPSGGYDDDVSGGHGGGDFHSFDAEPTVSKRFFTITGEDHDTGDDDETEMTQTSGGGHKNIDVIFAKAPSTSIKSALKAVSNYASEHQTAVYVLSQQLGAKQIGSALRASGIKPSTPQVHFIKYRTPEEAAHAQQQIRAQYNSLGGSTHDGGAATVPVQSVVGSLGGYGRRTSFGRQGGNSGVGGGNFGNLGSGSSHGFNRGGSGSFGGTRLGGLGGLGGFGRRQPGFRHGGVSNGYLPPRY